jgi:hypothetical protein
MSPSPTPTHAHPSPRRMYPIPPTPGFLAVSRKNAAPPGRELRVYLGMRFLLNTRAAQDTQPVFRTALEVSFPQSFLSLLRVSVLLSTLPVFPQNPSRFVTECYGVGLNMRVGMETREFRSTRM